MTVSSVELLVKQAERLSLEDQLALLARLAETVRYHLRPQVQPRKWHEIRGMVQHPMVGEDAQTWVSRNRQEDDQKREERWRYP